MRWLVVALLVALAAYAAFVLMLLARGRRQDARAWAGLVPDCVVLFGRLLADPVVPRRYKVPVVLLVGYLASPVDLVPDFIPVAGQLDDAILVALVLRVLLRGTGPDRLRELWPGPEKTRELLLRLAGQRRGALAGRGSVGGSRATSPPAT